LFGVFEDALRIGEINDSLLKGKGFSHGKKSILNAHVCQVYSYRENMNKIFEKK